MDAYDLENVEIDLLIETINRRYGLDFSHYSRASFARRIRNFVAAQRLDNISNIIPLILHDTDYLRLFMHSISITVTDMFRDPSVFLALRQKVIPYLKTYASVKIWHAGCATGEEVYSLAIILHEEGILDRCQIYATDFNDRALMKAKSGIYRNDKLKSFQLNYTNAGGKHSLTDYYHSDDDSMIIDAQIKKNIIYANHNLISDHSFGEMHLIICRNVLIYFDKILQEKVFSLFFDSLIQKGFLCLGTKESFPGPGISENYAVICKAEKIFMKN